MSRGANGGRRLDLKLHLSLPARGGSSSSRRLLQAEDEEESSPSSCVSSEGEQQHGGVQWSDSPEATSMVLAACPRCFLYVMLAEADPRCPRCRCPVILDFLQAGNEVEGDNSGTTSRGARRNKRE